MENNPQHANENGFFSYVSSFMRMLFLYFLLQYALGNTKLNSKNAENGGKMAGKSNNLMPFYVGNECFDMYMYMSEDGIPPFPVFQKEDYGFYDDDENKGRNSQFTLLWQLNHLCNIDDEVSEQSSFVYSLNISFSDAIIHHNASLFAHTYFVKEGFVPPSPLHHNNYENDDENHGKSARHAREGDVFYKRYSLIKYLPPPKKDFTVNLLQAKTTEQIAEREKLLQEEEAIKQQGGRKWIGYWNPNVTLSLVEDNNIYNPSTVPPPVKNQMITFSPSQKQQEKEEKQEEEDQEEEDQEEEEEEEEQKQQKQQEFYFPTIFFNDFWVLRQTMIIINETTPVLPLLLKYEPIRVLKFQMLVQFEASLEQQKYTGATSVGDTDEVRRMLMETNPYLLGLTMVVSLFHTLFDFLAFKNDIQFWNKNESMRGLSSRSVILNAWSTLIIFLYLLDNETSWLILVSSGVGLCIEFWKVTKALKVSIDFSQSFYFPLKFESRVEVTESETQKYDDEASYYLNRLLFPLVFLYAIYSLIYQSHKSWYSWILGSLVGCVYTFGFITMTPQLFINYKLKSVAALPWRTFVYKALNTFIDDLFAFIIKMPTMHRMACFRDDIIFLIFLYQRWIYPVDLSRINEFGQSGNDQTTTKTTTDATVKVDSETETKETLKEKKDQ